MLSKISDSAGAPRLKLLKQVGEDILGLCRQWHDVGRDALGALSLLADIELQLLYFRWPSQTTDLTQPVRYRPLSGIRDHKSLSSCRTP